MRRLMMLAALPVIAAVLKAQAPAAQKPPAQSPAAQTATAESPVPPAENWLTGWIDLGYRWNTGPGGSLETYRSVVNLGSGLKLIGLDFTIADPRKRLFDNIHVQAYDWTDPYSTLRVDATKQGLYRFTAQYRSLAYFNNLPSFADPLLNRGILLDEQSFDSRRHLASFELHLLPERRISPYLAFDHDGNNSHGATTFETGGNEYPVPYATSDVTNLYRGGVNVQLPRVHLTLEEGGTTYKSNQNTYAIGTNPGNSTTPVLGQTLDLTGLVEAWGVRGSSTYTRAVLTADPFSWLNIYGHFGYVDPHNNVNYSQYDTGNLLLLSQVLFYSGEQFLETAAARMPHTSGDAGWEIRPLKRMRIDQHWLTDRLHTAGSTSGTDNLLSAGGAVPISAAAASFLSTNYNQTETGVSFDATSTVALRAAYRYEWGDANDLVLPLSGLLTIQNSKLRRNVVLGSAAWRLGNRFRANGDFEWGSSGSEYFRTSLYNYRKARLMGRYELLPTVRLSADYTILSNNNPLAGSPYKYLSHQETIAVQWTPTGKKFDFDAAWEHCGYQTRIDYLDPTYLLSAVSVYREYCHDVTASINTTLPAFLKHAKVSAGGSALLTSGSRPTTFYQPTIKASAPITSHIGWFALWQYYGFGETYYIYENFRTSLVTTGLRFSR
jgi:hypothetical protein